MKNTFYFLIYYVCIQCAGQICTHDTLYVKKCSDVLQILQNYNFQIDSIRKSKLAPNVNGLNFPHDIKKTSYYPKKNIFLSYTLTAILNANKKVLATRNKLIQIKTDSTFAQDSLFVDSLKALYYANDINELLERVDILPPSLVIAQAIDESGWGTSYFSLQGNSIFGMRAPRNSKAPTLVHPRSKFKTYKFESLEQGIEEYLLNINRHRYYKPLRDRRAILRKKEFSITGLKLLPGLAKYSTRGQGYVRTIKKFIISYALNDYDDCELASNNPVFVLWLK